MSFQPYQGYPFGSTNKYFWNPTEPANRDLAGLAPSVLQDEKGIVTLKYILDHFDYFKPRLAVSTLRLLAYKYSRLRERIKGLKNNKNDKYKKSVQYWESDLKDLGGKDSSNEFNFGGREVWDVVKDNYPEYVTDGKALQALTILENDMKTIIDAKENTTRSIIKHCHDVADIYDAIANGTIDDLQNQRVSSRLKKTESTISIYSLDHTQNKSLSGWIEGNMEKLIDAINDAVTCMPGRDEELNIVSTIISAFSTEWRYATENYINFVILGPAGSGKTTFAQHMGKILGYSGLLFRNTFLEKTRSDFIGQFLGQSGPRTVAQLEAARESVLFIDEAYEIAKCNKLAEGKENDFTKERCSEWDSYSSEAMTALVAWLSQNQGQIILIAAGYQRDMLQSFMVINEGIPRRLQPVITLGPLSNGKLVDIFFQICNSKGIGRHTDKIGEIIVNGSCNSKVNPPISRKISREATLVLNTFMEADHPRVMEILETSPPQEILYRPIMKYEASDMVMLANKVNTYLTSRRDSPPSTKITRGRVGRSDRRIRNEEYDDNNIVMDKIGLTTLYPRAMELILDEITYSRRQVHITPTY